MKLYKSQSSNKAVILMVCVQIYATLWAYVVLSFYSNT